MYVFRHFVFIIIQYENHLTENDNALNFHKNQLNNFQRKINKYFMTLWDNL